MKQDLTSPMAFAFVWLISFSLEAQILPPRATTRLYVSSYGTNEVHCYEPSGSFAFKFSHVDLSGPRGLAFAVENELYAASQGSNRVLVFTQEGSYLRQFTADGLNQPTSLAFDSTERLYAAAFGSNEVFVFWGDHFERKMTASGLRGPNCIAFAATGDMYVASQSTSEVFRFTADGAFKEKFTGGGLSSAMGIAILDQELYVTGGGSHSIVVFDLEGTYLRKIQGSSSEPVINGPQGIAFDSRGDFAVSSFYTGKTGLYSPEGALRHELAPSGVQLARSVAFLGEPRKIAFVRGDFEQNGKIDLGDPVGILFELFVTGLCAPCLDAGDADDDGLLQLTDAIYLLSYLFLGGLPPRAPFPEAGLDPTDNGSLKCFPGPDCRGQ